MQLILQPNGDSRLGDILSEEFSNPKWRNYRGAIAFAKRSGVKHIKSQIHAYTREKAFKLIIGVDHNGTSKEALEDLREASLPNGQVFILHNTRATTFHPKIHLFNNEGEAALIIGSGNLTEGGLYTNYEAGIYHELNLSSEKDKRLFRQTQSMFDELLCLGDKIIKPLTPELITNLYDRGYVDTEERQRQQLIKEKSSMPSDPKTRNIFGSSPINPAPKLKNDAVVTKKPKIGISTIPDGKTATKVAKRKNTFIAENTEVLLIQIKPHHNGEIFLSKLAVNEKPDFFGYPFSGVTIPKIKGKKGYPQRDPDPVVNIRVVGKDNKSLLLLNEYNLNTVYYEAKSEIRITASPLISIVPEYSLMIMELGAAGSPIDYTFTIHTPDSPQYAEYVEMCDKSMPGGGKKARKYGWVKLTKH